MWQRSGCLREPLTECAVILTATARYLGSALGRDTHPAPRLGARQTAREQISSNIVSKNLCASLQSADALLLGGLAGVRVSQRILADRRGRDRAHLRPQNDLLRTISTRADS